MSVPVATSTKTAAVDRSSKGTVHAPAGVTAPARPSSAPTVALETGHKYYLGNKRAARSAPSKPVSTATTTTTAPAAALADNSNQIDYGQRLSSQLKNLNTYMRGLLSNQESDHSSLQAETTSGMAENFWGTVAGINWTNVIIIGVVGFLLFWWFNKH